MRSRSRLLALLVALVGLLAGLLVAAPASGAVADVAGSHIVWRQFTANFDRAHLVVAGPSGANARILTHPAAGDGDIDPDVSPDGQWVVFERDLATGTSVVGIVRIDGTGERILPLPCTGTCVAAVTPTWMPDGKRIVYTLVFGPFDRPNDSAASAVLWSSDLDGTHLKRFSTPGIDGVFEDYRARFSPNGYVVFQRVRNQPFASALFRMNIDGTGLVRLTAWPLGADVADLSPARSGPTADLVVFETYGHEQPPGISSAVATVSAVEGLGSVHLLTSNHALPLMHFNPVWSPDGQRIAYTRFGFFQHGKLLGDIWTMDYTGHDKQPVSTSPLFEFRPAWG